MQALHFHILSTAAALAVCAVAATDAHAALGAISSGPANYCRPALPAFDSQIRTRPLALQNEGTGTAFVTCSMGSVREAGTQADTTGYLITVSNTGNSTRTIHCAAVAGRAGSPGSQQTVTKSVVLVPDGEHMLEWIGEDFTGFGTPPVVSYSCALPPGTAINDMYVLYDDGFAAP